MSIEVFDWLSDNDQAIDWAVSYLGARRFFGPEHLSNRDKLQYIASTLEAASETATTKEFLRKMKLAWYMRDYRKKSNKKAFNFFLSKSMEDELRLLAKRLCLHPSVALERTIHDRLYAERSIHAKIEAEYQERFEQQELLLKKSKLKQAEANRIINLLKDQVTSLKASNKSLGLFAKDFMNKSLTYQAALKELKESQLTNDLEPLDHLLPTLSEESKAWIEHHTNATFKKLQLQATHDPHMLDEVLLNRNYSKENNS